MSNNFIEFLKNNPNNLSIWFPAVRDCGIRVPGTTVVPIPEELLGAFFMEEEGDRERIAVFVREHIMPVIERMPGLPFIKNGCSSEKFDFSLCCPPDKDEKTILRSIIEIQYGSLCLDKGGNLEIVIRDRIPSPERIPTIYNGMPLNTEFRVFYDFDRKTPLYCANYWDWDYCHDAICSRNDHDREAYEARYPALEEEYLRNRERVLSVTGAALSGTKSLRGVWSVDLLLDADGTLWLIDMAVGPLSVYWDPSRVEALQKRADAGDYSFLEKETK